MNKIVASIFVTLNELLLWIVALIMIALVLIGMNNGAIGVFVLAAIALGLFGVLTCGLFAIIIEMHLDLRKLRENSGERK
jgi:hypothetical protein